MINVILGTNTTRRTVVMPETATIKETLEENNVDLTGNIHLDGGVLTADMLNKTYLDLGITEKCFLIVTVKSDGGSLTYKEC